jgi:S-adenosylmethionine hydrolase
VCAPAAAAAHEIDVADLGATDRLTAIDDHETLSFPDPSLDAGGADGAVMVVDDFGNVITNIPGEALADHVDDRIRVNGLDAPVVRAYAERAAGERLVTVGSHGNVEFAVNGGRGDEAFDLEAGDQVRLSW